MTLIGLTSQFKLFFLDFQLMFFLVKALFDIYVLFGCTVGGIDDGWNDWIS